MSLRSTFDPISRSSSPSLRAFTPPLTSSLHFVVLFQRHSVLGLFWGLVEQVPWSVEKLLIKTVNIMISCRLLMREEVIMLFGIGIVGLLIALVCLGIYFLPSVIAYQRRHKNFLAILALNIFLGWTLFGWVGALVWSLLRQDL